MRGDIYIQEDGSPLIRKISTKGSEPQKVIGPGIPRGTAAERWLGMQAALCDDVADMIERKISKASYLGNTELVSKLRQDTESYRAMSVEYRKKQKNAEKLREPAQCSVCDVACKDGRYCMRGDCPYTPESMT